MKLNLDATHYHLIFNKEEISLEGVQKNRP